MERWSKHDKGNENMSGYFWEVVYKLTYAFVLFPVPGKSGEGRGVRLGGGGGGGEIENKF